MANRVPLTFDVEDIVLQALRLRAARESISVADAANALLSKALVAEIEEAAGAPPLAAAIQEHHNRQLREERTAPPPPSAE
jgi:plasmid stability protein